MKSLALVAALTFPLHAFADPISIPIPDSKWSVQFDSPPLKEMRNKAEADRYSYAGTAGKLNVSLFVEPPTCPDGESNEAVYKCFLQKLKTSPLVVASTIRGNELPTGVQVAYMVKAEVEGRPIQAINVHLLFKRDGKAGDFHASIVQPESADVQKIFSLVASVHTVDN
jgi:hypothetical protein